MITQTFTYAGLTGNSVVRKGERLAILRLSIETLKGNSVELEALKLVYGEVIKSGSGTLSREKFLDALSTLGASIEVSYSRNTTHYVVRCSDTTLTKTLSLFETMLLKPTFQQTELVRIQEFLSNQLTLAKEDAKSRAYQEFISLLASKTDSRYQAPLNQIITAIQKVSLADIKKFHAALWDIPWILTCGGSAESCKLVESRILKIRNIKKISKEAFPVMYPMTPATKRVVTLVDIPQKQNIEFSIGNTLALNYADTEFPAFVFGMSVLALYGGFTGRLMSTVREMEGLTYSIYGQVEGVSKSESGFWRIATFFNPQKATLGLKATLREIEKIQKTGITDSELHRFKAILHTRSMLIEDSILKKVSEAHGRMIRGLTEEEHVAFKLRIANVTKAEVNSVLRKYLNPTKLIISGAGPVKDVTKELMSLRIS